MASDSIFESFPSYPPCFMRGEYIAGLFLPTWAQFLQIMKWQLVVTGCRQPAASPSVGGRSGLRGYRVTAAADGSSSEPI